MTPNKYISMCLAMLVLAITAGTARSQTAPANVDPSKVSSDPTWRHNCPKPANGQKIPCNISQRVVIKQSNQRLLVATVRRPGQNSEAVMELALPLGLYLPAGVAFAIDENQPQRGQIQTCNKNGCFAAVPLSADIVNAMRRGDQMKFVFQALNRRSVNLQLPLKGFTAAYRKLR